MRPWLVLSAALGALVPVWAGGCGTDAVGIGECKQIEEARCRAAANCPQIPLGDVYHSSGSDVDACIRFYDVACLHGLEVSSPSPAQLTACVQAIGAVDGGASCSVVEQPWTAPKGACSWLAPSNVPEASTPETATSDAADAATEASDSATASDAGGD